MCSATSRPMVISLTGTSALISHFSVDRKGQFKENSASTPGRSAGASALGSGPRGRRFKSSLPENQSKMHLRNEVLFSF